MRQDLFVEAARYLQEICHINVNQRMFKERVEDLIGREYLERNEDDPDVLTYLA